MISYNNLDQYLKEFKFFEKIRTDKKIFTFTVTSHWHNYMLLVSNVLASRGICIDYYWKDYYSHDGKDSKDEILFLKKYFTNFKNKKKNNNLKFFNIENLQSSKVPHKLKKVIEHQSEIDASNHFRKIYLDKDTNMYKKIYLDKFNQNLNLSSKIFNLFNNKKINYHSALIPGGSFLYEWGMVFSTLKYLGVDCCSVDYNLFSSSDQQLAVSWNYSSVIRDDYQFSSFNDYYLYLSKKQKTKILNETHKINSKFKKSFNSFWHKKNYNTTPATQIVNQNKDINKIYEDLKIKKGNKIILLLPSHGYEQHYRMKNLIFKNYLNWLEQTINKLVEKKNLTIIVRCHPYPYNPNKDVIKYSSSDETSLNILKKNKNYNHKNLRVIGPFDKFNTYDLMKICDLGIVYTSLSGLELAMMGKKPIVCTNTSYSKEDYICRPKNQKDYFKKISALLKKNKISKEQSDRAKIFYNYFTSVWPKKFPWCFIKNEYNFQQFDFNYLLSFKSLFSEFINTFDYLIFQDRQKLIQFKKDNVIKYLELVEDLYKNKKFDILKKCIFKNYKDIKYSKIKFKYPELFPLVKKNKKKMDNIFYETNQFQKKNLSSFHKILKYFKGTFAN